ncbi:MAG: NUDIX domain-containing protein [Caulobacterales bacterium]|nr:NUDIX domain-containing protein [Caulobacterales bacterium]
MSPIRTLYRIASPAWRVVVRMREGATLGVRVLATDPGGRLALVRHTYIPGWTLPGGGVNAGEPAHAAARRELAEETGALARGAMEVVGVYANFDEFPNNHVVLFRTAQVTPGERAPDMEIAEIGWFALDALPDAATPATRRRIEEVFSGRPADIHWRAGEGGPLR